MIKPPVKLLQKIFDSYKDDTSKLLIHAATASWTLASIANVVGISCSKKIDSKQKKFLIPQEIADGATNIGLFIIITESLTKLAGKLADNGKIVFKEYAKDANGNILKDAGGKFIKQAVEKGSEVFKSRKGGLQIVASLIGAVVSSNILTPIIRNQYAASRQKAALKLEESKIVPGPSLPYFKQNMNKNMQMSSFLAFTKNTDMRV